jgi:hypothetical protein
MTFLETFAPETELVFCVVCGGEVPVIDKSAETIGFEEKAREVWVVSPECGHDIVTPLHPRPLSEEF